MKKVASEWTTIQEELRKQASPERAQQALRYFKTGPGEYGEGDEFLGIRVPALRAIAKKYRSVEFDTVKKLLPSRWHEERLLALLLLVDRHAKCDPSERDAIHRYYLEQTRYVNNWDLVDSSAPTLVGKHIANGSRKILRVLVKSNSLWERRIAIIATQYFIRQGDFKDALELSKSLLHDQEDLIHKAVGWMLREIGDRDPSLEYQFLDQHASEMPRTMLRYAIEKFPAEQRQHYLAK